MNSFRALSSNPSEESHPVEEDMTARREIGRLRRLLGDANVAKKAIQIRGVPAAVTQALGPSLEPLHSNRSRHMHTMVFVGLHVRR